MGVTIVDRNNNAAANDVLFAGGGTGSLTSATGLASTELWDYRRMRMAPGPAMTMARSLHVGVQLADGRTLLVGGANAGYGMWATYSDLKQRQVCRASLHRISC